VRFATRVFEDPRGRRFFAVAAALAALAVALAPLHALSALLSLPLSGAVAYVLCDILSHAIAGRDFVFPSKWGMNTAGERRVLAWSDHVLALLCGLLTVLGLFVFGEIVDWVRHENVWHV
jgi:hypothetical protein